MTVSFTQLRATAAGAGLEAVASMPIPAALDPTGLDQLLADGIGDMGWLAAHRDLRLQPGDILADSRSVLVVLLAYEPEPSPPGGGLRRARYAAGKDYHGLLRKRLAGLGRQLSEQYGGSHRATVDSAPVNERTLAHLAGLGWLGRNALLIHPKRGSYHFIGCLFSTLTFATHAGPGNRDRCGTCTACESACPTGALVDRRVLSERCISYLTIEHQGVIPRDLAQAFQGWWFGCDLCQEVCPWNRFAPPSEDARLRGEAESKETLLAITAETFDRHFAGRAVRRTGYERFRRNLLVATWSLDPATVPPSLLTDPMPLMVAQRQELGLNQ